MRLKPPSKHEIALITSNLECTFHTQSAYENGNMKIRKGIAAELQEKIQETLPSKCTLYVQCE